MPTTLHAVVALVLPCAAVAQSTPAARPVAPIPRTTIDGPMLTLDMPGLRIGVAEYDEGPTGTTAFYFPKRVRAAYDARGGAVASMNTDFLRLGYSDAELDAVVFSGGSSNGLAAAAGAADEIRAIGIRAGNRAPADVAGAIIYDIGGRRLSDITPDAALGRAALRAAAASSEARFPLGPHGAGRSAMQGVYFADTTTWAPWSHSGQGGAERRVGPTRVAVFTVVNAIGTVVDREGRVVRCGTAAPRAMECGTASEWLTRRPAEIGDERGAPIAAPSGPTHNTTLTLVVTNQKLEFADLQRLAVQVHASMARSIQPFNTIDDGDILFAVSTAEVDNPKLGITSLGLLASETAWDAVLASVPPLDPPPPATPTTVGRDAAARLAGHYRFANGMVLDVRAMGDRLFATIPGQRTLFYPAANAQVPLEAIGPWAFRIPGERGDWLRFEVASRGPADRASAVVLNPGQWQQRATRLP